MSHIFGLSHSLGGILEQGLNLIGNVATPFVNPFGSSNFPVAPGGSPGFNEAEPFTLPQEVTPVMTNGVCKTGKTETCVTIDNATGQVISTRVVKHRRRRKRLATRSDIADLAALKSILGGGKALDAWIATRGGR